ncbi:pyrroloquinoline quinone biosynthesis peptide chaperone PqqD [Pseudomonas fluorescens]|uniref:PqqA binding protein n=1 Tax=Pseudomonas fluorescens TaxID=294 RepID=A0A4Y9T4F0_PSEFL|nr:pyrroloquinoline quinone biosynthesis peptide chaperone PqqD [Pseudomonas fluorescens]TFW31834.1 pyrroloquinoline quinone biosynthesis peptide chaperone PqqD [Pseudomonas fluorescens]
MSFDRSKTPTWRPGYRFQYEPAQKGHVLLYPEGMITLNASAGQILERLDGQRSVATIIDQLTASFPGVPGIDEDVLAFLEVAHAQFWIE